MKYETNHETLKAFDDEMVETCTEHYRGSRSGP